MGLRGPERVTNASQPGPSASQPAPPSSTDRTGNGPGRWLVALLWAAALLLLLAIGWMALSACGLAWPGGTQALLSFCPAAEEVDERSTVLARERERQRDLNQHWQSLQLALLAAPDCPRPDPPLAATPMQPPEEPPAEVAALPEPPWQPPLPAVRPPPPPLPDPPPRPAPAAGPPAALQDIPEEAWEDRDLSFLDGCWRLISNYTLYRRGFLGFGLQEIQVNAWEACFDESGFGSQRMLFHDGTECSGPIGARFLPDGRLSLHDLGDVPCSDNSRIIRRTDIDCQRQADGTAICDYIRPRLRWPVRIRLRR